MTINKLDTKAAQKILAQSFELLKNRYFDFSGALVAPVFLCALILWMPQGKVLLMFLLPVLWAGQLEMVKALRAGETPPFSLLFHYFQSRSSYELIVPYAIASGVFGVAHSLLLEYAPFFAVGLIRLFFILVWFVLVVFLGPLIVYRKYQFLDALKLSWDAIKLNAAPIGVTMALHFLIATITLIPFVLPLFLFGMPLMALNMILLSEATFRE